MHRICTQHVGDLASLKNKMHVKNVMFKQMQCQHAMSEKRNIQKEAGRGKKKGDKQIKCVDDVLRPSAAAAV